MKESNRLELKLTLTEQVTDLVIDQVTDQVTDQVKRLLIALRGGEATAADLMARLRLTHRPTFRKNYLEPALAAGLIDMTVFDRGIADLCRTAEADGVFCYTFFKAVATRIA